MIVLVASSGTQVVAYTYDAWDNPLTTTGTMADTLGKLNPLPLPRVCLRYPVGKIQ